MLNANASSDADSAQNLHFFANFLVLCGLRNFQKNGIIHPKKSFCAVNEILTKLLFDYRNFRFCAFVCKTAVFVLFASKM